MMAQVSENKDIKVNMLKKRSDFLRIAALRKKWISTAMIIQMAPRPDGVADGIRVGYTASKKVGNAVIRNRTKRRLREVVKKVLTTEAVNNHDYVIIARREIIDHPFKELIRDMKWCLRNLHSNRDVKKGQKE